MNVCSMCLWSAMSVSTSGRGQALPFQNVTLFQHTLRQLKMCGWYWGALSSADANRILKNGENGSFIMRDSSDACHLFALSLKANNIVISVRVAFSKGQFKLDSCRQEDCPSFGSVVDLIDYYLESDKHTFQVTVPELGEFPVTLKHPILKEVPTLQHLCRASVMQCCKTTEKISRLPLPHHLKNYLLEFAPEETRKHKPNS